MTPNYNYPYKQDTRLPDLSDIIRAIVNAHYEDDQSRDPRPFFAILRHLSSVNERLSGHIESVESFLQTTRWDLIARDESTREITLLASKRLKPSIEVIIEKYAENFNYGKFLARHTWFFSEWTLESGNAIQLRSPVTKVWEQCDFELNKKFTHGVALFEHGNLGQFKRVDTGAETAETSWGEDENDPANPGGILRKLLFTVWLLNINVQDWHEFTQRLHGIVLGTYDTRGDINSESKKKTEEALTNVAETRWATMPKNISIEFKQLVEAAAGLAYEAFETARYKDMAIAMRGTANTSDLGKIGSYAAIEAQLFGIEEGNALKKRNACKKYINRTLIAQDVVRNYKGNPLTPPYQFEFFPRYATDAETESRIIGNLLSKGCELKKSEMSAKTGYTIMNPGETVKLDLKGAVIMS